jgi:hypothetical protein
VDDDATIVLDYPRYHRRPGGLWDWPYGMEQVKWLVQKEACSPPERTLFRGANDNSQGTGLEGKPVPLNFAARKAIPFLVPFCIQEDKPIEDPVLAG